MRFQLLCRAPVVHLQPQPSCSIGFGSSQPLAGQWPGPLAGDHGTHLPDEEQQAGLCSTAFTYIAHIDGPLVSLHLPLSHPLEQTCRDGGCAVTEEPCRGQEAGHPQPHTSASSSTCCPISLCIRITQGNFFTAPEGAQLNYLIEIN